MCGIDNYNHHHVPQIDSLTTLAEHYLNLYLSRFGSEQRPLHILGWSLGGQIALKMASQLENMGWKNLRLILLDAVVPDLRLRTIQETLSLDEFKLHIKNQILRNYEAAYVNTILSAVEAEHALHYAPLDEYETLKNTEVLLFKAARENPAVKGNPRLEAMNRHTLAELPRNNLETIATNLKVIELPCSHSDILSCKEEMMGYVL